MRIIDRLVDSVDRTFFKGTNSKLGERLTYILVNLFLMGVLFYVVLNTIVYDWTGTMYASGFHLNTGLDDLIPYRPEWAIFYLYLFFWATEITMVFFGVLSYKQGYSLAWSLVIINVVADLVYLVFPVTTDIYRSAIAAHPLVGNPFAEAMNAYFAKDPSFDCFPSLHAAVSTIVAFAWFRFWKTKPGTLRLLIAILAIIIAVGTILSTLFVKQHYIADEIAGIILALAVGRLVYGKARRPSPVS